MQLAIQYYCITLVGNWRVLQGNYGNDNIRWYTHQRVG